MIRSLLPSILLALASVSAAHSQDWAKKMFQETSHDFGVVARGATAEYAFEFTNLYEEDIHIASVRSSCGCTSPRVTSDTLKTFEKAQIIAAFNTRSFLGQKSATITVTIDKPYYAEVQLSVNGFIRGDVVFDPGEINLGAVDEGAGAEQTVTVAYAGRSDWRITDVRSANGHFEVELDELERASGRVKYQMVFRLKPDAPAGYIQDQLTLVTDDQNRRTIPVPVTGRIVPALTVSPASLFLGVLEPGEKVTKRIVVRGKQPFKVIDVDCGDDCFQFETDDESKALHFIPVTFVAGENPGDIRQQIKIETDLGGVIANCTATATIRPATGE